MLGTIFQHCSFYFAMSSLVGTHWAWISPPFVQLAGHMDTYPAWGSFVEKVCTSHPWKAYFYGIHTLPSMCQLCQHFPRACELKYLKCVSQQPPENGRNMQVFFFFTMSVIAASLLSFTQEYFPIHTYTPLKPIWWKRDWFSGSFSGLHSFSWTLQSCSLMFF